MSRRNVLLIIADDLGKTIGPYGSAAASTPRIDEFAAQSVVFDLAFASTASCSGSRTVIHTGVHTHENGQYGIIMPAGHFQTWSHVDTSIHLFNDAGFLTGNIAKTHVGPAESFPWKVRHDSTTRDSWWIAERCGEFFQRAKDESKPFFLTAAFIDPHRDRSRGGFGNTDVFHPNVIRNKVDQKTVEVPSWISDTPETRQELADYYEATNRFDQGVGFILDRLKEHNLDKDTLVVVTSDNGPPFVNSKATLFDVGVCLPFIVQSPDIQGGIRNPNLVSYIDMLPTFLDFAGVDIKARRHELSPTRLGRSILPILNRQDVVPESEWQHHIFCSHTFHQRENYWPTRVIRTRRYKYHRNTAWQLPFPFATDLYLSKSFEGIRNMAKPVHIGKRPLKDYIHRPAEELFDLEADPDEVRNLAQHADHRDILLDLRDKLEAWQVATHDVWLWKDGQSAYQINLWCTDEVEIPDRFDFDPEAPGTRGQEEGMTFVKLGNAPLNQKEPWPAVPT